MRKAKECRRQLKRCDRITSQIVCRGGPNKEARVKRAVRDYLAVGRDLSAKVDASLLDLCDPPVDTAHWEALAYFHRMLDKHLDLIQRRLLHEETIPAHEKVFSLFEPCLSGLLPNRDSACAFPFVCDGVDSNVVAFGTKPDRQGFNKGAGTASSPCVLVCCMGTGDEAVPAPIERIFHGRPWRQVFLFASFQSQGNKQT